MLFFSGFLSVFLIITLYIFEIIYKVQNTPFMDEIFHIPQAQSYCANNWTKWDSKITTLPGLYIISYVLLKPLEYLSNANLCSVYGLRFINVLASCFNFALTYLIIDQLQEKHKNQKELVKKKKIINLISSFNIASFPLLYFFTFLFYTDVWSVTVILLMYYNYLLNKHLISGVCGIGCVLLRQTNIIWIGLLLLNRTWSAVLSHNHFPFRQTSDYKSVCTVIKTLTSYLPHTKAKPPHGDTMLSLLFRILSHIYVYVFVCLLFVVFVWWNGGIVVGDKQAHTVVFHPMQFLYFLSVLSFFSSPFLLLELCQMGRHLRTINKTYTAICLLFCFILSELNVLQHPYLLADNRHVSFYLWRRIYNHFILRRLLVPVYVVTFYLLHRLMSKVDVVLYVSIMICIFLNLTPQYLLEFRYFIIPYMMCRLHYNISSNIVIYCETVIYVTVNIFIIYLFVNKTFVWSHEPDVLQRIIW